MAGKVLDCRRLACRTGNLLFFKACGLVDARRIESSTGNSFETKTGVEIRAYCKLKHPVEEVQDVI
ncbi:MAG: hypothetical protein WC944_05050 [Candidatus Cloacimonadaceae bacterium]